MTGPFAFLDEKPSSPFSFLDQSKNEGVLDYLGNLTSNSLKVMAVQNSPNPIDQGMTAIANLMYGNSPEQRQQLNIIKANLQVANATKGEAWDKVKEDLSPKNFFSKIGDVANGLIQNPGSMISGLPMALASTVGSPLEAATGLNLGMDAASVLSPEERAQKIKDTAAIAVSTLVGGVSRFALEGGLSKLAGVSGLPEGLNAASNVALNSAIKSEKIGLLGRNILKGGVEAGAAGASFGAVSMANNENQLSGILTGLMFAPIGIAGEIIGSKIRGGDDISKIRSKASEIFALRQLQYSPDKSLFDLSNAVSAMATSETMVDAAKKIEVNTKAFNSDYSEALEPRSSTLIDTKKLNTLVPKGEPGVKIEPNSTIPSILNVVSRDEEGKPNGLLTISPTGEKTADVFTVYVDPSVRRQGIATKLYDAAENAGYKLRSGQTGYTKEGKAFIKDRIGMAPASPLDAMANDIVKEYTDTLYNEFKSITEVPENPLGFDENFNRFSQLRGIAPEDAKGLKTEFLNRVHDEIKIALPIEEKSLYNRMLKDVEKKNVEIVENGSDRLRKSAIENNTYFDQGDAGVITLRDFDTNKVVGTFHSVNDAQTFLDNIGKPPDSINLDGNGKIPPSSSAPPQLPPNLGPLNTPPSGWLEKKYALWTTRLSFATANPTLFKNWDTLFNSNLHSNVFNVVDKAAKLADGRKSVWLGKLKDADNVLGRATSSEREHVFNWMETRSIQEHEQFGGVGQKALSPIEIALGKQIQNADLSNMYRYKNAMRSVNVNTPEGVAMDAELKKQFNIGPNEINALTLLSIAEKNQVQKVSVGSAVHYARLLQNPELALTRSEYAKKFNLSQKQLQTGQLLDKYFNDLADTAGISKDKLLFNYITHARLYENGSLPDAIAKYALDKPTEEFYAALNRTGELSTIERDPIRAALRYTNALFDTLYLNPAINQARENLKVELAKLPSGSSLKVERDANRYLRDVRHIPAEGDRYADAAINHLAGNTGINIEKGIARKWVNGINEVFTVAAQGARPWAGIRDFYSNTSKYFVKWGAKDASEMLRFGAGADLDNLRQSGLIENYTQLGLNSAVDEAATALSNAGNRLKGTIDSTAHKALTLSGQQYVNDMARAGAFLVTRNKVATMLRNLHGGDFGKLTEPKTYEKAYNTLQLERYSPPVIQEFDRLIKSNKTEEAANYLGNQNIQETFGNYANANHPSGWNNNFGRLVGKFGQWSINHRDYVVSLASRGNRTQRLQALGRLAITESSIAAAATLFGVNLSNFYSLPGMYFKGGPAGDLFYTAYNAMFGRGMEQESAIRKVKQLLPYDQVNEKMKGSIVVPFSFALTDLVEGLEMSSNGDMIGGLARIGGVRPMNENYQPSAWEEQIGNIVSGR